MASVQGSRARTAQTTSGARKAQTTLFEISVCCFDGVAARTLLGSLGPEREPKRGGVTRNMEVQEDTLFVRWRADNVRVLRPSVSTFLDHLLLAVETMEAFALPQAK